MQTPSPFCTVPINAASLFWGPLLAHGPRDIPAESLLFVRGQDNIARAPLLLAANALTRVVAADGSKPYDIDDFWLEDAGRTIATRAKVPSFSPEELFPREASALTIERHSDGVRLLHFSEGHYFHDRQIAVDYRTDEAWAGPLPLPKSTRLIGTLERLRALRARKEAGASSGVQPLRVALFGDSISAGANASGHTGAPPFQPDYGGLAAEGLRQWAGSYSVVYSNFADPGKNSAWGIEHAGPVRDFAPDLLLLAFGMNDASDQMPAKIFIENLRAIIARVRENAPEMECAVVIGMRPNGAWHLAYPQLRLDTAQAMRKAFAQEGDARTDCIDVMPLWDYVVQRKSFLCLTGNHVNHPNDYGHRLYAACVLRALGV